jgi:DNA-binding NarL/FixJ family response regulator
VEHGSQMALVSRAGGVPLQEPTWALVAQSDRREDRGRIALSPAPYDRTGLKQATMEARVALEEAVVAAVTAVQRALTVAEVLDEALTVLAEAEDATVAATSVHEATIPAESLSPREREVLALVAEGRSNKAIAEALFVSPNTIKTHVTSLLHKLHADTRAQLAALAVRGALF